jgi:hypothetical protein
MITMPLVEIEVSVRCQFWTPALGCPEVLIKGTARLVAETVNENVFLCRECARVSGITVSTVPLVEL